MEDGTVGGWDGSSGGIEGGGGGAGGGAGTPNGTGGRSEFFLSIPSIELMELLVECPGFLGLEVGTTGGGPLGIEGGLLCFEFSGLTGTRGILLL